MMYIEQAVAIFTLLKSSRQHTLAELDTFLLPEWHPRICAQRLRAQEIVDRRNSAESKGSQWLARKARKESESQAFSRYSPQVGEHWPVFELLPERAKLLLDEAGIAFPEDPVVLGKRVLSVSQSESCVSVNVTGCLVPQGIYWLGWLARLLDGAEFLRLQGIFVEDSLLQEFDSTLLADLAGNSFHTSCCAASFVTLLLLSARMYEATLSSRQVDLAQTSAAEEPILPEDVEFDWSSRSHRCHRKRIANDTVPNGRQSDDAASDVDWAHRRTRTKPYLKELTCCHCSLFLIELYVLFAEQ
jgi:hypothetical protein